MKKNANSTVARGPGRPKATVKWPNKKFTLADAVELNKPLTKLTVTKHLVSDAKLKGKSLVVKLEERREPASVDGLGRKAYVYVLRSRLVALKTARAVGVSIGTPKSTKARKTRTPNPSTLSQATQTFEDIKAALSAPTPVVMPDPAPTAEPTPAIIETPAPAPVAELVNG
jgi:hypothetical protein